MIRPTFDLRMLAGRSAVILGLSLLGAAALGAQSAPSSQVDSRWLPLLGCWRPTSVAPGDAAAPQSTVCIVRGQAARSVDVVTVARGAVADRVSMTADAQPRVLSSGGCTGWEQAEWSTSGRIVYLHSEFSCDAGVHRSTSGVISMVSAQEWVEVQTVTSGGSKDVRVSRYASMFDPTGVPADIAAAATEQRFASDAARVMYAADLTVPEVLEASKRLDASTVEGWLVETGRRDLHMDAKMLAQFSRAGVSSNITDLLVAMSYPDVFRVEHTGDIAMIPTQPRQPAVVDNSLFDHRPYDGYDAFDPYYDPYYDRYYSNGAYDPYSYYGSRAYGPNGSRYYSSYSTVIVTVPAGGGTGSTVGGSVLPQEPPGKVVNGRGYSRGGSGTTTTGTRGTGSSRNMSGNDNSSSSSGSSSSGSSGSSTANSGSSDNGSSSSSSGDSGSASSDGYSAGSGSTSTGRTAKPRDSN